MMITILGRRLLDWLRNGFVWSKTNFFILGLVFSYALVKKAVVDILIDFLTDEGLSLWQAVLVVLLLDWISAVFKVVVTHVSEVYSGRFSVIIFCTAVYAMGLMQFWICARNLNRGTLIFAVVLTALGEAGQEPVLEDYFDYQLSEEVSRKRTQEDNFSRTTYHWWPAASFVGSVVAFIALGPTLWEETFQISSYIMARS
ncbi:uncharacterized protein LOC129291618 isoform X2 [Prosopis cineraria]|uniref:uncharacterized protein LOC129291618 isoform X2 n=1 Tax=Prosopis cineraria TaxID=364024 RepID=UPI00240F4782|nr:uncharacterized protein LOC129291618 isoform X2 [Prosopis cineraria]